MAMELTPLKNTTRDLVVVGFSTSTRDQAKNFVGKPHTEFWGMNSLWQFLPDIPWSAWYEIHPDSHLEDIHKEVLHKVQDHYRNLTIPLYLIEAKPEYPTSERYPLEDILAFFKRRYFESTVAYTLAHALYIHLQEATHLERIHLYGIDMIHDTEWGFQRPNAEYWIGLCEGHGVEVCIPDKSALRKGMAGLYGFEDTVDLHRDRKALLTRLAHRQNELNNLAEMHMQKSDKELMQRAAHQGAAQELENIKTLLVQWFRNRNLEV